MVTGKDLLRDCIRIARRSGKSTTAAIYIKTLPTIYWDEAAYLPGSKIIEMSLIGKELSNSEKIEKEITAIRKRLS